MKFKLVVAYLNSKRTLEGIKPFVLLEMNVAGRTEPSQLALFDQLFSAICLASAQLEMHKTAVTKLEHFFADRVAGFD